VIQVTFVGLLKQQEQRLLKYGGQAAQARACAVVVTDFQETPEHIQEDRLQ
jgi:hypothetical protein